MENFQLIQNRSRQTASVINGAIPTLKVGTVTAAQLITQADALDGLAQTRDDAITAADGANNAEHMGFLGLQGLVLLLPHIAEAELDDNIPAETALLDTLPPIYAIDPRTTEKAMARARLLGSALTAINTYRAALVPPRPEISAIGKTVTDLKSLLAAQPKLMEAKDDADDAVSLARAALRNSATAMDRLNKKFYAKLAALAPYTPAIAASIGLIDTDTPNTPATLSIKTILQGGTDSLHLLVSYDAGTYDDSAESTVEWMVVGTDADFTHSVVADPSGNALGPFAAGKTVKLRTRATNSNGATVGTIRTLTLQAPPSA